MKNGRVFCDKCTEAYEHKHITFVTPNQEISRQAFVIVGFNTWGNAVKCFKQHEKGELHRLSVESLQLVESQVNVSRSLSDAKKKEMHDNRIALRKIATTALTLATQGVPMRGHRDERSNFLIFLKMRAEDVPGMTSSIHLILFNKQIIINNNLYSINCFYFTELKKWLQRDGYKWIHHSYIEEMIELFAQDILQQIIDLIKKAKYFAIIIDETTDVSRKEQVSVSIRIVQEDLEAHEFFIGFYQTKDIKSNTLFTIAKDVLQRLGLNINDMRGQCYDGAFNMTGHINGLQIQIIKIESRAMFVHCFAQTNSLVAQDGMNEVPSSRNFLATARGVITFIRDSSNRLACFNDLQASMTEEDVEEQLPGLSPFCPTRWCLRVKSLVTLDKNYHVALEFLNGVKKENSSGSGVYIKAEGFLTQMKSFEFYFHMKMSIDIFEAVELLNKDLQSPQLSIDESRAKVKAVHDSLCSRKENGFESVWAASNSGVVKYHLEDPRKHRNVQPPKRHCPDDGKEKNVKNVANDPKNNFRKTYYEVYNKVLSSLKERFDTETTRRLKQFEDYAIGKDDCIDKILSYYNVNQQGKENDFDKELLRIHRKTFLDMASAHKISLESLQDVVTYFKENKAIRQLLPEFNKFLRILRTIPATSCTAERSFSFLRILKTYLRSTLGQKLLNNLALLYIYYEKAESLDIEKILDIFIARNTTRLGTFALSKK